MERKTRRQDSRLTNRERVKKETLIAKQKKNTIIRRTVAGLGVAAALTVAVGGYKFSQGDESPVIAPQATESFTPLTFITEQDIREIAAGGFEDYRNVLGIEVDSAGFNSKMSLAPSIAKMTPEQYEKYCGSGLEYKCQEAFAITRNGVNEVYFYKEEMDRLFSKYPRTEAYRGLRDEVIYVTSLHEFGHWAPPDTSMSDELYELTIQHFGKELPDILDKTKYTKGKVNGAEVSGIKSDNVGGFTAFQGLEEAEVQIIAEHVLLNSGRKVYDTYGANATDSYHIEQRKLLIKLLSAMNTDYGAAVRSLAELRLKDGGRDEFMIAIGEKFGAPKEAALKKGFDILVAVNSGDTQAYASLTSK